MCAEGLFSCDKTRLARNPAGQLVLRAPVTVTGYEAPFSLRDGPLADLDLHPARFVGFIEDEHRLALEIELHGTIRGIVDDEAGRVPEGGQLIRAPAGQLPGDRAKRPGRECEGPRVLVQVNADQLIDSQGEGDEQRMGSIAIRDNDGMWHERCPPGGLLGSPKRCLGPDQSLIEYDRRDIRQRQRARVSVLEPVPRR